jgi:hypothetical protein
MAKLSKKKIQTDIEALAINIVNKERLNWEDAVCYVTEKVGFRMRELIRTVRKNYWGIFDEPTDPTTQRDKMWIPLARTLSEDVVKNIDLDQKDLQFRASNPKGGPITDITRAYVRDYLTKMFFGELLDTTERQMAIDGTVVWKTWEENGQMQRRTVDLLHIYIDPAEESIQSAFRFTERGLMTPDEIASMSGWINTKDITGSQNLSKNDIRVGSQSVTGVPTTGRFVDVWECWGKMPISLLTGKMDDEDYFDGHVIVSGLDAGDKRVHLIEKNNKKDKWGNPIKPYEEARMAVISGRWYGLGTIERVLALQEWLNTNVNLRINKGYISQLGLFKVRKGAGITPQQLAKLPSNGALVVQQMDDIDNFNVAPVDPTSYKDEDVITGWAQKVTQAYPVSTGESLPASQTATGASIESASSKSGYALMKDGLTFFLQRWMDRHALPIIADTIKVGDLVRLTGDDEKYKALVERIVANMADEKLNELKAQGIDPNPQEVQAEMQKQVEMLSKKQDLFVKLTQKIVANNLDSVFYVTNENGDTNVTVTNLINMLKLTPNYSDDITKQIYDLLGLDMPKPNQQPMQQQPQQGGEQMNPQTLQGITTRANVPQM